MSAGGRYKIHYRLSEVGKPLVFLAQDLETEQQVVVRPVAADQVPSRDVLMAIEHPNICKVLDLVETPGSLLMVTEFVSGFSLRQFQRDSHRMGRSLGWVLDQFSLVLSAQTQVDSGHKADNQDRTFEN